MTWDVKFHGEFEPEFEELKEPVQHKIYAFGELLKMFGPESGRPHVGTLEESRHSNLKELRFQADGGVWRVAFAFDTKRKGILLVAGDKSGGSKKRFYKQLIKKADERFDDHLEALKVKNKKGKK